MEIRHATLDDAHAIAALLKTIADIGSVQSRSVEATEVIVRANLERVAASTSSSVWVALSKQSHVVGYGAAHWVPFLFMKGGEGYITELFVNQRHAGRGIGSALLNAVIAESRSRGCNRLSLVNDREVASYQRGFYAKHGFVERPTMANFVLKL